MTPSVCQGCGGSALQEFYAVRDVPIHSCLLLDDLGAARSYPRRDVVLAFCHTCGLIQNTAFDPEVMDYSPEYEDSQAHSPRFLAFATELARHLVDRYGLQGGRALEIGCGKGDFLVVLANEGKMQAVGFDPAYEPGPLLPDHPERVRFVRDLFSERYAHESADLVCCRHTLEHVPDAHRFVTMVRRCIGDRLETTVFFEVPDVGRILEDCAFWDIYYEHCTYFSAGALARLFRAGGFRVLDLRRGFDDQYLLLEARPSGAAATGDEALPAEETVEELAGQVERFSRAVPARIRAVRDQLEAFKAAGERVAVWGASSKAVGYLATLGVGAEVEVLVDINPRKQGRFLAGSGHEIVAPADLMARPPDVVLLMNPVYRHEVVAELRGRGMSPRVEVL
jgi:SAM-dependent methyltransferase